MGDKRFCDFCGKDITNRVQRDVSIDEIGAKGEKIGQEWYDVIQDFACLQCGRQIEGAIKQFKAIVKTRGSLGSRGLVLLVGRKEKRSQ